MEMVPLRMRRKQSSKFGREPLLSENVANSGADAFRDEWYSETNNRRRRRQNQYHRPERDLVVSPSLYYEVPLVVGIPQTQHEQQNQEPIPEFPSLDDAQGHSLIHHIHHNLLNHHNPAKDLSIPLFSHGGLCCQCVRTQEIGLTENFGRFDLLGPGLHLMCWPYSTIASRISLRIQQLDVACETKTKDHVFVHIEVSVQYKVIPEMAYLAYYQLTDPHIQIRSYIFDVVRAQVPAMTLDDVLGGRRGDIANAVHTRLCLVLSQYDFGYHVVQTLCTNVRPAQPSVVRAMNEVEACRRRKEAMVHRGEADKVIRVKRAEAGVEVAYLHGMGTAQQRKCLAAGMKESAASGWNQDFSHVMDVLLVTQYMDLLTHVDAGSLIVRASPGEVMNMRQGLTAGGSDDGDSDVDSSAQSMDEEVVEDGDEFEARELL
ncbi:hypothetical protein MHU86_17276 [Fragilaria crotonensis]|nr:hypothetical protein MHU86_17276 [Fragilaria crotonensis]